MSKSTRISEIEKLLFAVGSVEVSHLSSLFHVSEMTIRRDFNMLVSQGKAIRTHGGATIPTEKYIDGVAFTSRAKEHIAEKRAIAMEAVKYLNPGDNVFIDDSSTCLRMAEFIPYSKPLIITTTSLTAALEFNKCTKCTVFSLGGELHKTAHSCFGPITQNLIKSMYFKTAFLGFYSITKDGLITTNSVNDLEIKKLIMQHSEKTIALIDSSKIHEPRFFQLGTIAEMDAIITDAGISGDFADCCRENHVGLTVVNV